MFELGELDLDLSLGALGALREDVEDQADAVDDAAIERTLEVALLRARQGMIENHQVGAGLGAAYRDLRNLAAAGEQRRVGPGPASGDDVGDLRARRDGGGLERGNGLCGLPFAEVMSG